MSVAANEDVLAKRAIEILVSDEKKHMFKKILTDDENKAAKVPEVVGLSGVAVDYLMGLGFGLDIVRKLNLAFCRANTSVDGKAY